MSAATAEMSVDTIEDVSQCAQALAVAREDLTAATGRWGQTMSPVEMLYRREGTIHDELPHIVLIRSHAEALGGLAAAMLLKECQEPNSRRRDKFALMEQVVGNTTRIEALALRARLGSITVIGGWDQHDRSSMYQSLLQERIGRVFDNPTPRLNTNSGRVAFARLACIPVEVATRAYVRALFLPRR
jgi:hypothetical protein